MYRTQKLKAFTFFLAFVMLAGVFLSGCGKLSAGGNETSNATSIASSAGTTGTANLEPYEITQYIVGSEQPDSQAVYDEMSKITKDKINVTLNIKMMDWGSYDQKIKVIIAASEAFDICFTAPWMNNYYDNVNKGAFLPLDDLLTKYAPNATKAIPEKFWNATRVNGKIYGFLNYQIFARADVIYIQKAYADKYGFDPKSIKTYKDYEPLLKAIKENEAGMVPIRQNAGESGNLPGTLTNAMNFEGIAGTIPGAIHQDDLSAKVIDQYEDPVFVEMFKTMRDWYIKGYWKKDAATITDDTADRRAGKIVIDPAGTYKPGGLAEYAAEAGKSASDYYEVVMSKPYASTGGIIATMFGISKTSKDPERAMMYLELVNTDKELYNLMCFGIKDKHYKQDAEGYVEAIENSGYNPVTDWEYGNQFNALYRKGNQKGNWEETIKLNESAAVSPLLGFNFDSTPVKNEIAQCQAVVKEYYPMLATGAVDFDKTYPEFIEKLKKAGSEAIIAEMQKQIDMWKKAAGK